MRRRRSYHREILVAGAVLFLYLARHQRVPEPAEAIGSPSPHALTCEIARVVDGDTLTCQDGEPVRLLLIDAPELSQAPFGRQAKAVLEGLLPEAIRARLELDVQERDRYGRVLAYIYARDGRMANEELARMGYVVVSVYFPNVNRIERLRTAVQEAKDARRGLWSTSAFECRAKDDRAGR